MNVPKVTYTEIIVHKLSWNYRIDYFIPVISLNKMKFIFQIMSVKIPKQGIWQNIMKKTILNGLIGLTLFGGVLMTYRVYEYYTGKGQ